MRIWETGQTAPDETAREKAVAALCREFPFVKRSVAGCSVCGRPLVQLELGEGQASTLFAAAFHGQEWLTVWAALRFFEECCRCLSAGEPLCEVDLRMVFHWRRLVLLPCVNPDGVEVALHGSAAAGTYAPLIEAITKGDPASYNANAHGVDLNHNYNAGWETLRKMERRDGIDGPAPRRFGGRHPESEPETQTLVRLCREENFSSAYAFHSQGEEIFWQYQDHQPAKSAFLAQMLSLCSGYALEEQAGLASHGGFKDWFLQEFHRPAFTLELGKGKNPLPLSDLEPIYEKIRYMLLMSLIL